MDMIWFIFLILSIHNDYEYFKDYDRKNQYWNNHYQNEYNLVYIPNYHCSCLHFIWSVLMLNYHNLKLWFIRIGHKNNQKLEKMERSLVYPQ